MRPVALSRPANKLRSNAFLLCGCVFRLFTISVYAALQGGRMVTGGFPNKVIASELNLSIKTIEKHRGSIMRKLRLRSDCELVQLWVTLTWDSILDMRSGWSHSQSTIE